jgi:hypothetical protein
VTSRARPAPLTAPIVAVVLALSACSGGGDGAAAPEEVDPKQAYVEQASEICTSADEQFAALGPTPATPAEFGPYVEQTVGIAGEAQTELAALTPPEDDRADLESKVLTPFAELVEQGRAWSQRVTAAGTDQAALLALLGSRPTSAAIDKDYLRKYGLTSCADAVAKVG